MGALFSKYGSAAGNSKVVHSLESFVLDVILIPAVGVVFVYDVTRLIGATGTLNTADRVLIMCLVLVFILLLIWVGAWATGQRRIVLVDPNTLHRLSRMVVKQSDDVAAAANTVGSRQTTEAVTASNMTESTEREAARAL
jgi:hypothetical protein